MAYTRDLVLALGAGKAGLADLRAQLVDTAGTNVGAAVSTGFVEIGTGAYLWHYAAFPDSHRGAVKFYSNAAAAVILAATEINPEEHENANVKTSTVASGGASAADVWAYATRTLTQSAASVLAILTGSALIIHRGDTTIITLTGLGSLAGRSKLWFTLKRIKSHTDAQAILQVEETAGLLVLNGAAGTAAEGVLAVTDATAGNLTVTLLAVAGATLPEEGGLFWDVQMLSGTTVTTKGQGTAEVTADVTRAVS